MTLDVVQMHRHAAAGILNIGVAATFIGEDKSNDTFIIGYKMLKRIDGVWYKVIDTSQPHGKGASLPLALEDLRAKMMETW
jgi:hypothetical protein